VPKPALPIIMGWFRTGPSRFQSGLTISAHPLHHGSKTTLGLLIIGSRVRRNGTFHMLVAE
jgi:hypothetical protein